MKCTGNAATSSMWRLPPGSWLHASDVRLQRQRRQASSRIERNTLFAEYKHTRAFGFRCCARRFFARQIVEAGARRDHDEGQCTESSGGWNAPRCRRRDVATAADRLHCSDGKLYVLPMQRWTGWHGASNETAPQQFLRRRRAEAHKKYLRRSLQTLIGHRKSDDCYPSADAHATRLARCLLAILALLCTAAAGKRGRVPKIATRGPRSEIAEDETPQSGTLR